MVQLFMVQSFMVQYAFVNLLSAIYVTIKILTRQLHKDLHSSSMLHEIMTNIIQSKGC